MAAAISIMPSFACAVSDKLRKFLQRSKATRIIVAYSGGLDSSVLLHLVKNLSAPRPCKLLALHINHCMHPDADDWVAHCHQQAQQIGVACQSIAVQVSRTHRQGLEAAAREARYQALQSVMNEDDLLLTAHHQNDHAETVLLRLLRGTGVAGLRAIAEYQTLDKGALARPLLSAARNDIRNYAQQHQLEWLDDPANEDLKYARNYLRHRVIPLLAARWPMWYKPVTRYATHQATATDIIESEAQRYLDRCLLPGSHDLLLRVLITLAKPQQHLVLRAWCQLNGIAIPNQHQLNYISNAISVHINERNAVGSGIIYSYSDIEMGIYHGTLRVAKLPQYVVASPIEWHKGGDCEIPQLNLTLTRTELMRQAPSLFNQALTIMFRRGGERCACRSCLGKSLHKSLKKIFQEHHIPSWDRGTIPLIYAQGRLRLIWGITECD
ncbi:MAG: tRNA lysidine(34) synthetase TilS [Chromatiales bacterium]|nr:tRNA lysidine(34) synthetase TilS [Chromatiales bacterium]